MINFCEKIQLYVWAIFKGISIDSEKKIQTSLKTNGKS